MDSLVKSVIIDGVRYVSKRRPTDTDDDISCQRCAFHGKRLCNTLLCQSPEHHDLCDFCVEMLKRGWHTWFEQVP